MNDLTSVSVSGAKFRDFALYVWVKPHSARGVVFSYATESNPREMALLFNEKTVFLHLGGQIV